MKPNSFFLGVVFLLVILAGCSRDDGVPVDESIAIYEPNRFAQFLNPIAGLQAGDYSVIAATVAPSQAGNFSVTLTFDGGEKRVFNDNWIDSVSMNRVSFNNPCFDFTLSQAGGIDIKLESTVDTYLFLIKRSPGTTCSTVRSGFLVGENNDISVLNTNSQITLSASLIDSASYGTAYYAAIDPTDAKTTLEDWKVVNGYYVALAAGEVINARFRDTKDLGYGRGMRVWTNTTDGSFYAFVENFQVAVIPGQEYSTLNLEALITDDRKYHFGTNAIEFSTYPYGTGEPSDMGSTAKFTKFYSFDATSADPTPGTQDHVNETRLISVNLDGRGDKSMPGACVYCHGGTLKPLLADGTFRDNSKDGTTGNGLKGDTNAKLQLLEVNSFEFGSESPFTRPEQEVFLKQINQTVYCTYPNSADVVTPGYCAVQPADPVASPGAWAADFAREVAEGWYDDPGIAGLFDSPTFIGDFVPVGWRPDVGTGNPPPGADQLFLKAVGPNCFLCHSRRGVEIQPGVVSETENEHIDMSTYDKFIGDAELVKQYVYDFGVMPLSLRGHVDFWGDKEAPVIMASFLNGVLDADNQINLNSDGGIDKPGASIADAGPDRSDSSPTRLLGANSRFVNRYSWSIISTPVGGEAATLTGANTISPFLTAAIDGDYVIQLTASNGKQSDSDTVLIKVNSALSVDPKDLLFMDAGGTCLLTPEEVCTIFETVAPTGGDCVQCHDPMNVGFEPGIPVWWVPDAQQPVPGTTFYEEVRLRVNFNDPTQSPILTRPTGEHHFGGLRSGFEVNNPTNRQNYDKILNWIMAGARKN
jgi:hypothetical protein